MERELIWEELSLDDLLVKDSFRIAIAEKLSANEDEEAKRDTFLKAQLQAKKKQEKIVKKPSYTVLMDRYKSLPHKPVAISRNKLNELADPIVGRMSKADVRKYEKFLHDDTSNGEIGESNSISPNSRVTKIVMEASDHNNISQLNYRSNGEKIAQSSNVMESSEKSSHEPEELTDIIGQEEEARKLVKLLQQRQPRQTGISMFLTEAIPESHNEDEEDEDEEVNVVNNRSQIKADKKNLIGQNIKDSKFANMFRNRVLEAQKVSKLAQPLNLDLNQAPMKGRPRIRDSGKSSVKNDYNLRSRQQTNPRGGRYGKHQPAVKGSVISRKKGAPATNAGDESTFFLTEAGGSQDGSQNNSLERPSKVYRDPLTKRVKTIKSSGYGRQVQRFSHLPLKKPSIQENKLARIQAIEEALHELEDSKSYIARAQGKLHSKLSAIKSEVDNRVKRSIRADRERKKLGSSSAPNLSRSEANNGGRRRAAAADKSDPMIMDPPSNSNVPSRGSGSALQRTRSAQAKLNSVSDKNVRGDDDNSHGSGESYSRRRSRKPSLPVVTREPEERKASRDRSRTPQDRQQMQQKQQQQQQQQQSKKSIQSQQPTQSIMKRAAIAASKSPVKKPVSTELGTTETKSKLIEDSEEPQVNKPDNKVDDISSAISKLQLYEKSMHSKAHGEIYSKPDINGSLYKHAERLGSHLSAAENILKEYEALKDGFL